MDKPQVKLEALKMIKDWSVWLVAIQATICAFLWNVVKVLQINSWLDYPVLLGWYAFALSIIVATLVISYLPSMIERLESKPNESTIFAEQISILGIKISLRTFLSAEYFCFLTGVILIIIHFARHLPVPPPSPGCS
jgi:hypothetical protein